MPNSLNNKKIKPKRGQTTFALDTKLKNSDQKKIQQ